MQRMEATTITLMEILVDLNERATKNNFFVSEITCLREACARDQQKCTEISN